jgi:hypothetical protein
MHKETKNNNQKEEGVESAVEMKQPSLDNRMD